MAQWNLWHGCHKKSEGCLHCYMFRGDERYGRNPEDIHKTSSFLDPIKKNKNGKYKYPKRTLFYTCFSSDFFLEEADEWRKDAWRMIKERSDCTFFMITKRPERIKDCLPEDWLDGYPNVTIYTTCENQIRADERIPIIKSLPIKHIGIINEPLLGPIDYHGMLDDSIVSVVVGGESGPYARPCDFEWVKDIKRQCEEAGVAFGFKQTGLHFIKDGKMYQIPRKYQFVQAKKAFKGK